MPSPTYDPAWEELMHYCHIHRAQVRIASLVALAVLTVCMYTVPFLSIMWRVSTVALVMYAAIAMALEFGCEDWERRHKRIKRIR